MAGGFLKASCSHELVSASEPRIHAYPAGIHWGPSPHLVELSLVDPHFHNPPLVEPLLVQPLWLKLLVEPLR